MRSLAIILLCAFLATSLTGCSLSLQPEHQAYIISMGVDEADDGQLEISVQFPTIGGSSTEGQSNKENSAYLISSASGSSLGEAMDLLRATLPRNMQLSQMKSIVISDKVAGGSGFHRLVRELTMTYQLYGAATVIVCIGSAKAFLEAQQPVLGSRLSTSVTAELEHYQHQGYMPVTTLSELYASMHSIYSTSILTLAATAQDKPQPMAPGRLGEALPGTLNRDGENKNEYMGCALIDRSGRMVGQLNGLLTQWVEILRGDVTTVSYMCADRLTGLKTTLVHVDIDCGVQPMTVRVHLKMISRPLDEQPPLSQLARSVETDLNEVTRVCQALGVEPFKWSQIAARRFPTIGAFQSYRFIEQFQSASVSFSVELETP